MSHDPLNKIKPEILRMKAYDLKPVGCQIKLNQNENPFDIPAFIKEQVAREASERAWGRYPDFKAVSLCQKLAKHTGWIPAGVAVGNGSNELLQTMLHLVLERSKKLLIVTPTFALYRIMGLSHGATVLEVPFEDFTRFPRERLLEMARRENPDVMIFCSPNNPTGALLEDELLHELLELSDGLIVVDQAYREFSEHTGLDLLCRYPNLVITRTFSKAMAAAGLRLGYMLAHPEVIGQIDKVKLPYNLNFFSLAAAEAILDNLHYLLEPIQELILERRRLFEQMTEIKEVEVFPSHANFLLFRVRDASHVFSELCRRGILVRNVSFTPGLENCLRVSVGLPEENLQFLRALKESLP
ncbi:MAG TPA: histidinol-phosphate transaminase [Acidobacteriota bacterium]|nr:histidinol-phosphate transaminase [Acidobacteriota bacterium]